MDHSHYFSVKEKLQAMLNLDRELTDDDYEKVTIDNLSYQVKYLILSINQGSAPVFQ